MPSCPNRLARWMIVMAWMTTSSIALMGCGGSDVFRSDSTGGSNSLLTWWNAEERTPAGAGNFTPDGVIPVIPGTTWVGPVELAAVGVVRAIPSALDPSRSESVCSTFDAGLIECLTTDYDLGMPFETTDVRATPGATVPTGTWTANDAFFPGGVDSTDAFAEHDAGDLSLVTFILPGVGHEQRQISFSTAGLVAGTTYTVGADLLAFGFRFRFPLVGATTEIGETATAGTLTITTAPTAIGTRVAGSYDLTFPGGSATGSFDATVLND